MIYKHTNDFTNNQIISISLKNYKTVNILVLLMLNFRYTAHYGVLYLKT